MQTKKASYNAEMLVKYCFKTSYWNARIHNDKTKHLTSLKAVELRSLVHYRIIEPRDNRTCIDHTSYFKELVELFQGDITLTLVKMNTSVLQLRVAEGMC